MLDTTIFSRVRAATCRFAGANQGNIAVLFAIAAVPIISFVGAAIDYTRANAARSAMQAALDSTALMLGKDLTDNWHVNVNSYLIHSVASQSASESLPLSRESTFFTASCRLVSHQRVSCSITGPFFRLAHSFVNRCVSCSTICSAARMCPRRWASGGR